MIYNFSLSHIQHGACQILGSSTAENNEDAISCMPVLHQSVVPIAVIFELCNKAVCVKIYTFLYNYM